jgi:Aldo/keto reductase family
VCGAHRTGVRFLHGVQCSQGMRVKALAAGHENRAERGVGMQTDLLPTCRELGIAVLAYSPLGRGFLTGTAEKEKPYLGPHPWWTNFEKVMLPNSCCMPFATLYRIDQPRPLCVRTTALQHAGIGKATTVSVWLSRGVFVTCRDWWLG